MPVWYCAPPMIYADVMPLRARYVTRCRQAAVTLFNCLRHDYLRHAAKIDTPAVRLPYDATLSFHFFWLTASLFHAAIAIVTISASFSALLACYAATPPDISSFTLLISLVRCRRRADRLRLRWVTPAACRQVLINTATDDYWLSIFSRHAIGMPHIYGYLLCLLLISDMAECYRCRSDVTILPISEPLGWCHTPVSLPMAPAFEPPPRCCRWLTHWCVGPSLLGWRHVFTPPRCRILSRYWCHDAIDDFPSLNSRQVSLQ